MGTTALFVTVYLACAVEGAEALTIVLAAGTGRDWRSASAGVLTGLAVLAVLVVVLGPAVTAIPLSVLRLVVGGLLLIFGLQWLRKSILRAGGLEARHDEDAVYAATLTAARDAAVSGRGVVADWYAFTLAFKGVTLEGLKVVFMPGVLVCPAYLYARRTCDAAVDEALATADRMTTTSTLATLGTRTWLRLCRALPRLRRRTFTRSDSVRPQAWERGTNAPSR